MLIFPSRWLQTLRNDIQHMLPIMLFHCTKECYYTNYNGKKILESIFLEWKYHTLFPAKLNKNALNNGTNNLTKKLMHLDQKSKQKIHSHGYKIDYETNVKFLLWMQQEYFYLYSSRFLCIFLHSHNIFFPIYDIMNDIIILILYNNLIDKIISLFYNSEYVTN